MTRPFLTIALPVLFVGAFQLVSCQSTEIPPAQPGGVYLSTSGGASFNQSVNLVDDEDQLQGYIDTLSFYNIHRPAHLQATIYLIAGGNGLFVSSNDGESWRSLSTPLSQVTAFVHLPNDVWLVSGTNQDNEGIVMRSLDTGQSWAKVLTIPAATVEKGQFFQIINPPPPPAIFVANLVPDPFNNERVYATTSTGEILTGEESGKVWHSTVRLQSAKSNPYTGRSDAPVRKVIPSPHKANDLLLVGTDGDLIRANNEETTRLKSPPGQVIDAVYISQFPNALFISTTGGMFISRDYGENWVELKVPISKSQPIKNAVIRVSPSNPDRLLVTVNSIIYRSEDGGQNWNALSLELPNHLITDISINPQNAARVILITSPVKS
ncbi:MAG: hypothetical protein A3I08_02335 [Candidatus Andersenbacteria bacterium RIFCSPLOWO2_02_FULL_46_11]|nr:MAG: hypothetical protein A3I08_02335 [Candidatus Andersenbacteria bacterium RIFCSPLOWO2_02_FULL_46_11]